MKLHNPHNVEPPPGYRILWDSPRRCGMNPWDIHNPWGEGVPLPPPASLKHRYLYRFEVQDNQMFKDSATKEVRSSLHGWGERKAAWDGGHNHGCMSGILYCTTLSVEQLRAARKVYYEIPSKTPFDRALHALGGAV